MTPTQLHHCSLHEPVHPPGERKLLLIIGISLATMVMEIIGGSAFHSVALLSDGWHMGTHVLALGVAFAACRVARRIAADKRFAFGPGKVSALGGFAGAILLGIVAVEMFREGLHRLLAPEEIRFNEAILVAVVGLTVNTLGAVLLHESVHDHRGHNNDPGHDHGPGVSHGHDQNMRAAYLHVIADALTSILAIAALVLGKIYGWIWPDAVVAMVGGIVIMRWSWGLLKSTGAILLDFVPDRRIRDHICHVVEGDCGTEICDLHLWPRGHRYGLLATVIAHDPNEGPLRIKHRLREELECLDHVTVEFHSCDCRGEH